ncbi:4790_t:CDS:2 [Paraglomus occultum]|uniref:4790_t:CDS:1 n=1 Tax=Paraglomus occultum TaxID=144539 RepID=A0A9N9BG17_9GLOM|nr:4790_t:CDS:2 [Paraglomus occultum]
MSEEPKITKRKAAPKRNSTRAGRVEKTTAVESSKPLAPREAEVLKPDISVRDRGEKGPEIAYSLSLMSTEERQENILQGIVIANRTTAATNFPRDGKESGSVPLSNDDMEVSLTTPSSDSAKVC